jgi:glycosyltransferase involved in cell wall biosynthesis
LQKSDDASSAVRLLYLVERPIQYQAPLLRRIAAEGDIHLTVCFETLGAAAGGGAADPGFARTVRWDVPLLDGYDHVIEDGSSGLRGLIGAADAVWMHGWAGWRQRAALQIATELGVPVLMRGENTDAAMPDGWGPKGWLKRRYLAGIFDRCAGFLCIGSANRRYYLARGVPEDALFFMPYAVDNDFFAARCAKAGETRDDFRTELGLAPGRPVVLFAGKLQRRKGADTLLDAFRRLGRDAARQPYLLFVGDGEQRSLVEKAAARDEAVRFLGFRNQTELPAFYDLADVFVLASKAEPWGLAVNEAMNGACAVVVSDECGCAEDLVSPDRGAVVPAGDDRALARALERILGDEAACAAMGQAAREAVAKWDFDKDIVGLKRALAAVGLKGGT